MAVSNACWWENCEECVLAACTCNCHADDDERTYGGYATQDEYYDEWGWP